MFKPLRFLLRFCLLILVLCLFAPAQGQFKQVYLPDASTLTGISQFDATGIIATGLPGKGIAICGSLTGKDTSNTTRQTVYLMQMSELGEPQQLDFFQDTSSFLLFGPRAYGMTYDGNQNFYMCVGSNDNQTLLSIDRDGNFRWGHKANHHEFYSAVMDNGNIVYLGQDESVIGIHDYAVARVDSNGNGGPGMMFGTVDFDIPKEIISVPDGYVMAGYTFYLGFFNAMVIKCDKQFNLIWSRIYSLPSKDMTCEDLTASFDGGGYLFTGRTTDLTTGMDSLYIMQLDTGGLLDWFRLYGIDSANKAHVYSLETDPLGRGYLVCGDYQQSPRFEQAMAFMVDKDGDGVWMRDYGAGDSATQEILRDVDIKPDGSYFFSVGEITEVDSNNQIQKRMMVVKADLETGAIPCDSALTFGERVTVPIPGGNAHEEPFFAWSRYDFTSWKGEYNNTVICSVLVTVDVDLPRENSFSFVNPAAQELVVDYTLTNGPGRLELVDLQGRVLRQFPLREGIYRERFRLSGFPQGLYFLTARGDDWKTETKRLIIAY